MVSKNLPYSQNINNNKKNKKIAFNFTTVTFKSNGYYINVRKKSK